MGRLFGTDGVRGLANADLTAGLAVSLAQAAAGVLAPADSGEGDVGVRPLAVVGWDPRASSELLTAGVASGLASAGVDVLLVGVLPTPAVAYLTADYDAALGVMISASHNPMPDNGIKFFAKGGHKLEDAVEDEIEAAMDAPGAYRPTGAAIGRIRRAPDSVDRYVAHLGSALSQSLSGIKVVVDAANGAASTVAAKAYRGAGADVVAIHDAPDGLNINLDCGSTHMESLQAAVVEHGADLGLAHDGDADRCLAVAADGSVIDGDAIMAVLALDMHAAGELTDDTLVATVMSNKGLHIAMRNAGIDVRTTGVGDRYVLEELRAGGYALGGEQSGHVVLPAFGTTGDGVLTGLRLMGAMAGSGRKLAELASVVTPLPQVLINVRVQDKAAALAASGLQSALANEEAALGDTGRILLRQSGTEQLIRVMVEAPTEDAARGTAERLAGLIA
ncbi:phosphoglucosamine mutase [Tsukamurella sp. 8F]|uniref:phosphoglucosamine mutase n=1 Tax=unclassified Tsukamurella TaxID=2633480 RepID=UPI0023B99ABC|nr:MULTISPECIES: phosphoglucosamine mutase [unclassified Tsukamurella]MDF0531759.1 phosphoglucosamine mutase [Tsukamurella sp. 8J]MDF0588039.1 phosphoglucosamine mutase [Tsukamurella sp. 8F]